MCCRGGRNLVDVLHIVKGVVTLDYVGWRIYFILASRITAAVRSATRETGRSGAVLCFIRATCTCVRGTN